MAKLKDWLSGIKYTILSGTDEGLVRDIVTDSREASPGMVFVAISGSRLDGHDFIKDVINLGCRDIVAERAPGLDAEELKGVNIIKVNDTRKALSYMSAARFSHPADLLTLIGITGTKGKTSTSYMLRRVFKEAGTDIGVIGTNGCRIGDEHIPTLNTTPDSYLIHSFLRRMADKGIKLCVMECSSQGFKLMRTLGLRFSQGIFLNISPDHIGPAEHEDFNEYLECKKALMRQSDTAVINIDDEHAGEFKDEALRAGAKVVTYSCLTKDADIYAFDRSYCFGTSFSGSEFRVGGLIDTSLRLSIPGDYYVYNALSVIACATLLNVPIDAIKRALCDVRVDGRMEVVYRSDKFMCIVDYAHNGISMENLIRTLRSYKPKRIVVVFGCGGNRSVDRRIDMGRSAARHADFAVITSDNSRYEKPEDIIEDIADAYIEAGGSRDKLIRIPDRREAITYALSHAGEGDIIAVIGKGHEDYQEENGVRRHFLDKEEILKAVEKLGL